MMEKDIEMLVRQTVERLNCKEIKVQLDEGALMPVRIHPTDSGADLKAPADFTIEPYARVAVNTGVHIELGSHMKATIETRSSWWRDKGCFCMGLVDEDYRGPIGVTIQNLTGEPVEVKRGDRIAQLVISPVLYPDFVQADALSDTDRGQGGLGSTGR